ncbi:hypothetical protein [Alicyclobacillus fastidiosus]|uniref:hypothetical protein n=1 Tax=Alicyclobacillus fastidiosus TaxID=392011 RepID=UPI0023EA0287|nr:hypothetical protein [Alicyclobacillus fastidiosus]GMA65941.1 hypothetical protein GCM10025859_63830 [Alicyclobacillus fastidiosus]GMA66161.1 hypothetical protein GCM10025859_66030 [Alicyclobacillus fastidiosus]
MTEKDKIIQIYREVLTGKRHRFPNHLFVGDRGKKYVAWVTRYLLEDYLQIPVMQIPQRVNAQILWEFRLRPPAQTHGWNYTELIQNAYPGLFKPWDFKQVSNGYWQKEDGKQRAIEAIRYVLEDECDIPIHEIPKHITYQFFKEHGLSGAFNVFGQSTYEAVNAVYPGRFKPWEFTSVPMNYWQDPVHVQQAMNWLIFEIIGFNTYQESLARLTARHFHQHQMTGLLQRAFNSRMSLVQAWIHKQLSTTGSSQQ